MENLKPALANWDGRAMTPLKNIYVDCVQHPDFIPILSDWSIQNDDLQNASTWLLKHHLDQKNTFSRAQTLALLPALAAAKEWPAQLHLLQMLPHLPLAEQDLEMLLEPIEKLMQNKVKFVKAWAYYAFGLMSQFLPELKEEAAQIFQMAMANESAAIKARIRKACQAFDISVL